MSAITTHILDTSRGRPAAGVGVHLAREEAKGWQELATGTTDEDGRASSLLPPGEPLETGIYRLRFEVGAYFDKLEVEAFYPWAEIVFKTQGGHEHYHVPLLLNPFGYSTYRGS